MSRQGQLEIEPHHRNRLAVVYFRQATLPQVREDFAYPSGPYPQARFARAWGWAESAIRVIDEDAGRSGSTVEGRPGFQRLRRMIQAGQVGLVLVSDLTRLSRSGADLRAFLGLCQKTDTLVAVGGILADPSTMDLRESSPRWVGKNAGSVASQRKIRDIFRRYLAEGKSVARRSWTSSTNAGSRRLVRETDGNLTGGPAAIDKEETK